MLSSETRVAIPPFVERPDGDTVIIGNPTTNCFLSVGSDAVALLHWLADGKTVGEASAAYVAEYSENPDVEAFLAVLVEQGFFAPPRATGDAARLFAPPREADHSAGLFAPARAAGASGGRGHFEAISVRSARALCSWPALIFGALVTAAAMLACVADPSIVPSPMALVFEHDQLGLALGVAITTLVTVFVHELAHLVAARAAAVPSRMGVGTRLWVLVAETDMSGIWIASRRQRCLAFLAGSAVDVVMAAALLLSLFASNRSWIELDQTLVVLVRATIFVIFTRLLWQLYLFLPTDLYYVMATLCGCKNLMQDTRVYLINQLARITRSMQPRDQSDVPPREMRVVRWFALVWLAGRALAFASLFLITLPVLAGYAALVGHGVVGDDRALRTFVEGPPLLILAAGLQSIGLLAWLRSLVLKRRSI